MTATSRAALGTAFTLLLALAAGTTPAVAASASLAIPSVASPPPLDPQAPASAWSSAATVTLPWDVQHQRPGTQPTEARIATDGTNVVVRFDVTQREPLLATQHTNDVGDGTDDEVWIDLWPNGNSGFFYQFAVNANGTRWQYSSENSAYSPTWTAYGRPRPEGGFIVTMEIPLRIMRGSGGGGWKAQFVRIIRSTGERQIWSYGPAQTNGDDVVYAGAVSGIATARASRPKPRFAPYGLAIGGRAPGASTSRSGFDFSIPYTSTSSFYGTIHPDFSNVEVDQQTISPTAFARNFNEVRPFFTQSFYDPFSCDVCPGMAQVYTPSIPTPRDGYAIEGKEGRIHYGAFDAVGVGRTDAVAAASLETPDKRWQLSAQTVAANQPGLADHVDTTGLHYNDSQHIDAFLNYGIDRGTRITDKSAASRLDGGAYFYTNTFGIGASLRRFGSQYRPYDGYVQHPGIGGYAFFENKMWLFAPKDAINSIQLWTYGTRYHGPGVGLNQTDNDLGLDILMRNRIDVQLNLGSSYLRLDNGIFTPISQNGLSFTWHSGTANNVGNNGNHGSSATPTTISYNRGRFGPGLLQTWQRSSTMVAGPRGTISLELDDTSQAVDAGFTNTQWLEKAGYTYAAGRGSSFSVGVRRIIGSPPILAPGQPVPPSLVASNVSFAYHRRLPHDELYFAYGDASELRTVPQILLKVIHYFGAEKGT